MKMINILAVDDRPEGLLAIKAVLDSASYNVVTATSGKEALKCLLNEDFAVILLDVQMPEMNGFEVASVIKTREKSQNIPIIFMSAISRDEAYVYQGYDSGAIDYILKPFDPYILKSKVRIFAEMYRKNELIREQARLLHESEIQVLTLAMDRLELEGLRRYRHLADSIPQIVFRLYSDGRDEFFNKIWADLTGVVPNSHQGIRWLSAIHSEDAKAFVETFQEARKTNAPFEVECRILTKSGGHRWHLFRLQPERETGTDVTIYWLGTATDIQDRRRNEENQRFLSEAGLLLSSSLEYDKTLQKITDLVISSLADWCTVDLIDEERQGDFRPFAISPANINHDEASVLNLLKQVLRSGKAAITSAADESYMAVPLIIQDRTIGAMAFGRGPERVAFDPEDLKLGEELARRAEFAFLNTRLYRLSQEAVVARNEFLSIASHELNTPITSLKMQLEMTKKILNSSGHDLERFDRAIATSMKQVDRLINLIKVLLDVSHIQSGMFFFDFQRFDLSLLLREIEEKLGEIGSISKSVLTVTCPQELYVCWDRLRMEQVLINLVNNAFKYAPGKIEIQVQSDESQIHLTVKDYGEGIPENKISTIFKRFERADGRHNISGLGLGLFIVDRIVQGHCGRIRVSSELGKGTIFNLHIPNDPRPRKVSQQLADSGA